MCSWSAKFSYTDLPVFCHHQHYHISNDSAKETTFPDIGFNLKNCLNWSKRTQQGLCILGSNPVCLSGNVYSSVQCPFKIQWQSSREIKKKKAEVKVHPFLLWANWAFSFFFWDASCRHINILGQNTSSLWTSPFILKRRIDISLDFFFHLSWKWCTFSSTWLVLFALSSTSIFRVLWFSAKSLEHFHLILQFTAHVQAARCPTLSEQTRRKFLLTCFTWTWSVRIELTWTLARRRLCKHWEQEWDKQATNYV